MNSLSWIIYLADVVGFFGGLLLAIGVVFLFISAMGFFCMVVESEFSNGKALASVFGIALFFLSLSGIIPSSKTMYMIAASEMGEAVIDSGEMKELYNLLREKLIGESI